MFREALDNIDISRAFDIYNSSSYSQELRLVAALYLFKNNHLSKGQVHTLLESIVSPNGRKEYSSLNQPGMTVSGFEKDVVAYVSDLEPDADIVQFLTVMEISVSEFYETANKEVLATSFEVNEALRLVKRVASYFNNHTYNRNALVERPMREDLKNSYIANELRRSTGNLEPNPEDGSDSVALGISRRYAMAESITSANESKVDELSKLQQDLRNYISVTYKDLIHKFLEYGFTIFLAIPDDYHRLSKRSQFKSIRLTQDNFQLLDFVIEEEAVAGSNLKLITVRPIFEGLTAGIASSEFMAIHFEYKLGANFELMNGILEIIRYQRTDGRGPVYTLNSEQYQELDILKSLLSLLTSCLSELTLPDRLVHPALIFHRINNVEEFVMEHNNSPTLYEYMYAKHESKTKPALSEYIYAKDEPVAEPVQYLSRSALLKLAAEYIIINNLDINWDVINNRRSGGERISERLSEFAESVKEARNLRDLGKLLSGVSGGSINIDEGYAEGPEDFPSVLELLIEQANPLIYAKRTSLGNMLEFSKLSAPVCVPNKLFNQQLGTFEEYLLNSELQDARSLCTLSTRLGVPVETGLRVERIVRLYVPPYYPIKNLKITFRNGKELPQENYTVKYSRLTGHYIVEFDDNLYIPDGSNVYYTLEVCPRRFNPDIPSVTNTIPANLEKVKSLAGIFIHLGLPKVAQDIQSAALRGTINIDTIVDVVFTHFKYGLQGIDLEPLAEVNTYAQFLTLAEEELVGALRDAVPGTSKSAIVGICSNFAAIMELISNYIVDVDFTFYDSTLIAPSVLNAASVIFGYKFYTSPHADLRGFSESSNQQYKREVTPTSAATPNILDVPRLLNQLLNNLYTLQSEALESGTVDRSRLAKRGQKYQKIEYGIGAEIEDIAVEFERSVLIISEPKKERIQLHQNAAIGLRAESFHLAKFEELLKNLEELLYEDKTAQTKFNQYSHLEFYIIDRLIAQSVKSKEASPLITVMSAMVYKLLTIGNDIYLPENRRLQDFIINVVNYIGLAQKREYESLIAKATSSRGLEFTLKSVYGTNYEYFYLIFVVANRIRYAYMQRYKYIPVEK